VQSELTDQTCESVAAWIGHAKLRPDRFLFPSRVHQSRHLTTRQYARLVNRWVAMVGPDPADYSTNANSEAQKPAVPDVPAALHCSSRLHRGKLCILLDHSD